MKSYRVREQLHEELVPHLLLARGVMPEAHDAFLSPDYDRDSHDPFLLPDMAAAVDRILSAKKNNEKVAVWSDYDCDGIPGGVMLCEFLRVMGLMVTHYIPHRHKEGYGLNVEGLNELKSAGVSLVITIDLGTTEVAEVAHAKSLGIDVIITDHHLVQTEHALPEALALINPKRPDSRYPFDGLCGAGVAWKLVQAILSKNRPDGFGEGQEKWLLDLVGIATLSDMVPLRGENRMLARNGLLVMRRGRRPGLAALLKLLHINARSLTEDDVTFMVSPRINAASRMDTPQLAARLLAAEAPEAAELALQLNRINDERKWLVASTVKEVSKRLADLEVIPEVIVMGSTKWRPGIVGLVANKLVETTGKTAFVWGREGGEELRGSCRAAPGVNVVELMAAAQGGFDHFGGHAASGGFGLVPEQVHELSTKLNAAFAALHAAAPAAEAVSVDRELELAELAAAQRTLARLSPFGVGNEKPLFLFPAVSITGVRAFGRAQDHLEVMLERGGSRAAGVSFFSTPDSFQKKVSAGERADIVGHVELDWRGQPRLRIVDVL